MRLEGNATVKQRFDHIAPFFLVTGRAQAEGVEGEPLGRRFLDLVPEQEGAGRVSLERPSVRELSVIISRLWQIVPLWVASTSSPTSR